MSVERKKRVQLNMEVVYDDGEGFMCGPCIDISESGIFIETVMPLKSTTKVRVIPLLPEKAGMFEFEGEVVRQNEYDLNNHFDRTPGMGIRFIDPDPDQIIVLRKYLDAESDKT